MHLRHLADGIAGPFPRAHVLAIGIVLISCAVLGLTTASAESRRHAIAMHGEPALPAGYPHFPYVNPDAPKGGRLTIAERDDFDNLNPFIPKGTVPSGVSNLVYERLMARSADEPFTLYGLIAESVEVPPDRSWIVFHLDPKARFSDGKPITADDVLFSHDLLKNKGQPYMRGHYGKVARAEKLAPRTVKFTFSAEGDRELPLILGLMPVLPKHAVDAERFDQTTLEKPIGSGPYVVDEVTPPSGITFRRDPDYWAKDHPARRGMHNFEEVRLVFYRDDTARFEAFKIGQTQLRPENDPGRWINGYDFPAVRDGRAKQVTFATGSPAGMTGFVFNTRRKPFHDIRVRNAFLMAFDAPSINKALFHGRFERSQSYFARSSLASTGRPADGRERALLRPFPGAVRPDIMAGTWRLEGSGATDHRANLKRALNLLMDAGYRLENRRLVHGQSGEQMSVRFLVRTGGQQRIALSFSKSLRRLGIEATVRQVEGSQYWARLGTFDFDIIQWTYRASLSPGNEQYNRWSTPAADIERSLNFAGVKNPAVDAMIDAMVAATHRPDFEAAVRAFDRALLSGTYMVPLFHIPEDWYAVWSTLKYPPKPPLLGTDHMTWWFSETD